MKTKKKKPSPKIKGSVFDLTGKKKKTIILPEEIFAASVNQMLLAQAIRVYLTNQRRAWAKAKTRAEVIGSRRKIWRQKGTGRARHGDRYAPIFVGGGVAHGPKGNQNYRLKLTKKMRRAALRSALTVKFQTGKIIFVDGLKEIEPKTKVAAQVLAKILPDLAQKKKKKCLIVLPEVWEKPMRAFANLAQVELTLAQNHNPYWILRSNYLIMSPAVVTILKEWLKPGRKDE